MVGAAPRPTQEAGAGAASVQVRGVEIPQNTATKTGVFGVFGLEQTSVFVGKHMEMSRFLVDVAARPSAESYVCSLTEELN